MLISSIYLGIFDSFSFLRCLGTCIYTVSFAFYGEVLFCNSPKEYPEKAVATPVAP
jgi:hypothetical protein